MSRETIEYLNANTLIGFTSTDGNAWHWDGITTNHYPLAIPVGDITSKLFNWRAEFLTPLFDINEADTDFETEAHDLYPDSSTKAVVRIHSNPKDISVFNYVTETYAIHQYPEWLIENVSALVDQSTGELEFGSAGLLRGGAVAWVQIRPPEMVEIGGDKMLRYVLAVTSHNSTIATTYKVVYQRAVCDNTLDIAMGEAGGQFRVKHTSGSGLLVAEARQALDLMFTGMEEFDKEILTLMNTPMSTNHFASAIKEVWPQQEAQVGEHGETINQRSLSNWEKRFDELFSLYDSDTRVGQYKGTKWGGLMAYNTWNQWGMMERGTNTRDIADVKQSQLVGQVRGTLATGDREFLAALDAVMA